MNKFVNIDELFLDKKYQDKLYEISQSINNGADDIVKYLKYINKIKDYGSTNNERWFISRNFYFYIVYAERKRGLTNIDIYCNLYIKYIVCEKENIDDSIMLPVQNKQGKWVSIIKDIIDDLILNIDEQHIIKYINNKLDNSIDKDIYEKLLFYNSILYENSKSIVNSNIDEDLAKQYSGKLAILTIIHDKIINFKNNDCTLKKFYDYLYDSKKYYIDKDKSLKNKIIISEIDYLLNVIKKMKLYYKNK